MTKSSSSSSFFGFSPKSLRSQRKINPDVWGDNANRRRCESLEEKTIHNTTIFNFNGNKYSSKIVDVDETNTIQIIFKFNDEYNRWKCKLNFKHSSTVDEKLTHIYLKSFINTVQVVKCFFFDKQNYLLIDIIDKVRMTSVVTFIQEKTNEIQYKNKSDTNYVNRICEKTANCMSHVVTNDIIDYDEYISAIHGNDSSK